MTAKEAREFVLSKWKDAELVGYPDGDYAIFSREAGHASGTGYIGWGQTKYNVRVADEAWIDAASNLPTPVEPKAQVESASVEAAPIPTIKIQLECEGCTAFIELGSLCDKCAVELASHYRVEPAPKEGEKKDLLNMEKINSLPHPLFIRLAGDKEFSWALEYVDVETGLLKFDVCGLLQSGHIRDVAEFKDANGTVHDAETFYSDYEPAKVEARGLPPLQEGWTNADYFEFLTAIDAEEAYEAYGLNISDSVIEYVARKESTVRQRTDQLKASLLREKEQVEEVARLKGLLREVYGNEYE